jgi:hypothetical protein
MTGFSRRLRDAGGYKIINAAPGSETGDLVTWEQLQIGLGYIIGVRWNTASNSPVLEQVDAYGEVIAQKTHAWFDAHPIFGNIWRCTLTAAGVPTFGANARGDGLTLDGTVGNVMVRYPKCYVKAQRIGTYQYLWVSPIEFTGFEVHPWFLQRGGTERDQAYMGAYPGCLSVNTSTGVKSLISKTGEQPFTGGCIVELPFAAGSSAPVVGETLTGESSGHTGIVIGYCVDSGAFGTSDAVGKVYLKQPGVATSLFTNPENMQRTGPTTIMATTATGAVLPFTRQLAETYANNIGSSRWGCADVWGWDLITNILYRIEYCDWRSQSTTYGIGQGVVNKANGTGFAGENNGAHSANTNIAVNGTGTGTGTDGLTPIVYRGIENPWGNVWQFIIGLDALDASYRILKRDGTGTPACPLTAGNYENTVAAPYTYDVTLRPDGYITNLLYEEAAKYLLLPSATGGSSATYIPDYFWAHRPGQTNILLAGCGWYAGAYAGVGFRVLNDVGSFSYRYCAARCAFV